MSSEPAEAGAKALVVDANVAVREALGRRVLSLLEAYAGRIDFLAPEVVFADVRADEEWKWWDRCVIMML